jgi:hypothetical protein
MQTPLQAKVGTPVALQSVPIRGWLSFLRMKFAFVLPLLMLLADPRSLLRKYAESANHIPLRYGTLIGLDCEPSILAPVPTNIALVPGDVNCLSRNGEAEATNGVLPARH